MNCHLTKCPGTYQTFLLSKTDLNLKRKKEVKCCSQSQCIQDPVLNTGIHSGPESNKYLKLSTNNGKQLHSNNRRCSEKKEGNKPLLSCLISLMISKQSCELSRHRNRTNILTFVLLCSGYL